MCENEFTSPGCYLGDFLDAGTEAAGWADGRLAAEANLKALRVPYAAVHRIYPMMSCQVLWITAG